MKKLLLLGLSLISFASFAQKEVYMRIIHQLDGQTYQNGTTVTTSEGDDLTLSRMQYYVSGIKLYHDGGQMLDLDSVYLLVDAATTSEYDFGSLPITTLDSMKFAIGVDQASNHLDPAQYAFNHPLAPKTPSMHWGWAAGYRFVCAEGMTGSNMSDAMEIHALGNVNYFEQTIVTSGTDVFGSLVIQLDAEYLNSFNNIDMSGGLISHGETGASITYLENFRDNVFTESTQSVDPVSVEENTPASFTLSPNPANLNNVYAEFGTATSGTIRVLDLTGREVFRRELNNDSRVKIDLQRTGVYLVELRSSNKVNTQRLVVNQ
ncbi:MbnP family protein [Phaeocystidibacter luteus]|uniref:T9SS type A sorting domain-containing protein n=1 Tax=Phaeocystidibacter luteus TaxID=911197 RepID=A0A6N6RGC1_9FLAO|nr:MbnP family protein [Phaeocystidibacter luteus]KAB2808102.1 T9SS type A sorting domain-containing protein [Phaeocystidibacter luteus]